MGKRAEIKFLERLIYGMVKNRKINRLKDYNYSQDGFYFVTICTKGREDFFGKIEYEKMIFNKYGEITKEYWLEIPKHFPNCILDEFIIMPNHIHGILFIDNKNIVGNADNIVGNADLHSLRDRSKMYLSKIIHGLKSSVTREIHKNFDDFHFGWQKSFYDHIIRDEKSFNNIRQYIIDNPKKWDFDKNNSQNITE